MTTREYKTLLTYVIPGLIAFATARYYSNVVSEQRAMLKQLAPRVIPAPVRSLSLDDLDSDLAKTFKKAGQDAKNYQQPAAKTTAQSPMEEIADFEDRLMRDGEILGAQIYPEPTGDERTPAALAQYLWEGFFFGYGYGLTQAAEYDQLKVRAVIHGLHGSVD